MAHFGFHDPSLEHLWRATRPVLGFGTTGPLTIAVIISTVISFYAAFVVGSALVFGAHEDLERTISEARWGLSFKELTLICSVPYAVISWALCATMVIATYRATRNNNKNKNNNNNENNKNNENGTSAVSLVHFNRMVTAWTVIVVILSQHRPGTLRRI